MRTGRTNMRALKAIALLAVIAMAAATEVNQTEPLGAVSRGLGQFSTSLLQAVVETNPGNLIMSPLSAATALAMVSYGSAGGTLDQFKSVLHLPASESTGLSGYQALINTTNSVKKDKLVLANRAFVDKRFALKPTYQQLTEKYFHSVTLPVDFSQSQKAAETINTWVEQTTNNRIKDLISPGDLNGNTPLVLVNAVYFKGSWKNKFDAKLTTDQPFYANGNREIKVSTMYRRGQYNYGDLPEMNARFIELPYEDDSLSMLIVLPNELNGLEEVNKKMRNVDLKDILNRGYEQEVDLHLPKFKIESTINLIPPLQNLGLVDAFEGNANFSGISDVPLAIAKIIQKAFIEVNEEGSEAAAATGAIMMKLSLVFPMEFNVNRPFYYSVIKTIENENREINTATSLFAGFVDEPKH